jgi:hypothetical protein
LFTFFLWIHTIVWVLDSFVGRVEDYGGGS